jgi:ABC-2 type transport system ATP-binding protein|tara:strand:+ start:99 stop:1010 length:912 start_codon:yes stop_codon:yes gene_type:complete
VTKFALEIQQLNKTYRNGVRALNDINLNVQDGDLFAFLGPNGAGKSTVIGIITTLVNITSGSVKVYGMDVVKHPEATKKMIGVVPQEYNLNQFIPIQETMINIGGYFGLSKKKSMMRTQELFEDLDIWHKRESTPRELSGGMKRRLMIARALIHNPKLLILDEPTAGVDTELRLTMWDFFKKLNQDGVTIILTTHYLEEAERLCKNLAIIHHGEVVQNSPMSEVISSTRKHTYIIRTDSDISKSKVFEDKIKIIDEKSCEIMVDNKISISQIINEFNKNNVNVVDILSKRNKLEELFIELTQK